MSKVRVEKVQELMKQEVSDIIFNELKDPRIGFVTVTSVACTEDLREAKIYVSVMGDEKKARDTLNGLNSSLGFVRREIGKLSLDLGAAGWVVHLNVDAARLIVPVEIVLGIGDDRADLVKVCADDVGDLMGNRCRAPRR